MLIQNALVYGEDFTPRRGSLAVRDGKIAALGEQLNPADWGEVLDAQGARLVPGFIDIHVHGGLGYSVGDANAVSLDAIARLLASQGVTSFCPAVGADSPEALEDAFRAAGEFMGHERGAYIHGMHMEGPFIAPVPGGAQKSRHMRWPSAEELLRLRRLAPVAVLGMAPELPGARALAREASQQHRVAFAHSTAAYEEGLAGLEAGFSHAVRLFCDMPPLLPRAPGLAAAVLDDPRATAELICDGVCVHPAMVRAAFRLLGEHRAAVVSDAAPAAGLPGSGGGSLFDGFCNLLAWGIDESTALRAVTLNPARVIGAQEATGSLEAGKAADLLLADENWNLRAVIIHGVLQETLQMDE